MQWRRRLVVTAIAVLLVIALAGLGMTFTHPYEQQEFVTLPVGSSLSIQGGNGPIAYETWQGDEIVINVTKRVRSFTSGMADWINERAQLIVDEGPDHYHIAVEDMGFRFLGWVTIEYHVLVPDGWSGSVDLRTSNGSITAIELHGDATLRTSNGRIVVRNHTGSLNARTSNGGIELSQVESELHVHSSNGAIRIEQGVLRGVGSIETSNGALELNMRLLPDASYEARTSNGRVQLTLAEPDVALRLQTSNGSITYDTEIITTLSDRNRLEGRIGAGNSRLDVRTSNGSITLSAR